LLLEQIVLCDFARKSIFKIFLEFLGNCSFTAQPSKKMTKKQVYVGDVRPHVHLFFVFLLAKVSAWAVTKRSMQFYRTKGLSLSLFRRLH
jgi:hypothetical protein